ncbi:hypothetical protein HGM15179_001915 [Zosterops borbonicus]|uniref:ribonuclease H n=1 Tax=Zosterops borbonicus TaxID=364589 RepID=A0A8K1GTS1_9PASS|nr:hypothetical protein HGM15179_001915 [Zosterops borbonicus]
MPLTDWKKVQTALADLPETAARIFPVKRLDNNLPTYPPVNPKDVQAVAKVIAEKGINSAMVSTLIDGLFGNNDMLPFDIKQTCRMIIDGAGMIVFKQEWEDNLEKILAKVSRDQHPLRNSSLQRLMGQDPQMVSPQAQAQGLRASEIAATTRAAREAIRTACRIVAKPSPWTTIRQTESEHFTTFVDCLQAAIDASDLPSEAKGPVLEGCLRQQCNQSTKELLRAIATYPSLPFRLTWKSSDPVYVEQWPIPEPRMSALLQLVQRELEKGHIEPSVSPWNTPVFIIPKCSGEGFHLLHDLRAVNKKIQPMGPIQTRLPGNSFIPTNQPCAVIDIKDCFFSILLHEEDKERFAFSIVFPNGQQPNLRFQWKVLPQGMINSPTIWQIVVSKALAPVRSKNPEATIIQYMDDILIAASSSDQVDTIVTAVSSVLKANGFEIAEAKIKKALQLHS